MMKFVSEIDKLTLKQGLDSYICKTDKIVCEFTMNKISQLIDSQCAVLN